jgi:hypothetical protein
VRIEAGDNAFDGSIVLVGVSAADLSDADFA